jgi:glutaredoxin
MKINFQMLNNGQRQEATVHFEVTAGVPAEAKKGACCDYCEKPKEILHTDELAIEEVIIDYVTITDESILRKAQRKLRRHFGLQHRKYCMSASCTKKHHQALQKLESNE